MRSLKPALLVAAGLLLSAGTAFAEDADTVKCVNKTCPEGYSVVGLAGGGSDDENVSEDSGVSCICSRTADMDDTVALDPPPEVEDEQPS